MALNIGGSVGSNASYSEGVSTNAFNVTTNTTKGEKKPNSTKPSQLRYPLDMKIEQNTDYLQINIFKYTPPGYADLEEIIKSLGTISSNATSQSGKTSVDLLQQSLNTALGKFQGVEKNQKTTVAPTIFLPIPNNLSDSASVSWGPDSMNPLQMAGTALASGSMTDITGTLDKLKKGAESASGVSQKSIDAAIAALSSSLANQVGGNVSTTSLISRATGQVFNPNLELLYEGSGPRSFSFTFDFAPRNKKEGQVIMKIIREMKKNMLGKRGSSQKGGVFIESPNVFEIQYKKGNKPHPFLNSFLPMALTGLQLSYTGSGAYATYYDGTPVHMQMSLSFQELNPLYAEDYEDSKEKKAPGGVGY